MQIMVQYSLQSTTIGIHHPSWPPHTTTCLMLVNPLAYPRSRKLLPCHLHPTSARPPCAVKRNKSIIRNIANRRQTSKRTLPTVTLIIGLVGSYTFNLSSGSPCNSLTIFSTATPACQYPTCPALIAVVLATSPIAKICSYPSWSSCNVDFT